jgi:hypothetical protein
LILGVVPFENLVCDNERSYARCPQLRSFAELRSGVPGR